jgi:hypothetical protein
MLSRMAFWAVHGATSPSKLVIKHPLQLQFQSSPTPAHWLIQLRKWNYTSILIWPCIKCIAHTGLQRCGKSCRLRWFNYLRPGLKHAAISPQEEQFIIYLHSILGNRFLVFFFLLIYSLVFFISSIPFIEVIVHISPTCFVH